MKLTMNQPPPPVITWKIPEAMELPKATWTSRSLKQGDPAPPWQRLRLPGSTTESIIRAGSAASMVPTAYLASLGAPAVRWF